MSRLRMRWSSGVARGQRCDECGVRTLFTLQLCYVHPELIALFQHSLSPVLNEFIESHCKASHTLT